MSSTEEVDSPDKVQVTGPELAYYTSSSPNTPAAIALPAQTTGWSQADLEHAAIG